MSACGWLTRALLEDGYEEVLAALMASLATDGVVGAGVAVAGTVGGTRRGAALAG